MGTIAQDYLRKMHGFDTREEIESEVDAAVNKTMGEKLDMSPKAQKLRAKSQAKADLGSAVRRLEDEIGKLRKKARNETDDKKYDNLYKNIEKRTAQIQKLRDEFHKKWDKVKR